MGVTAVLAIFVTVVAGVVVLGFWSSPERRADPRSVLLVSTHVGLAALTTTVWIVYLISEQAAVAVLGVGLLLATVAMGTSSFLSSRARERTGTAEAVPVGALAVHGAFAALALGLTIGVALRR